MSAVKWRPGEGDGWRLVDVDLMGEPPWGFTLTGGREHGEPLIITRVEEGSEADAVQLEVGDEIVSINGVVLSGYRQEAISLLKSSHKSMSLVIRRRAGSMDKHCSWHSSKVTEGHGESARTQAVPIPVRNMRHDSSSEKMCANCRDQTNMPQVSSSLGSIDNVETFSRDYYSRSFSATHVADRAHNTLVGSLDGYTCSSTSSTSSKNTACKPNQWDLKSRVRNGGLSHGANNSQLLDDQAEFQQLPMDSITQENIRTYDLADYRSSSSGKPSVNPVWNIPDKKSKVRSTLPSSSESFALSRAHEKGLTLALPGSDGLGLQVSQKSQDRDADMGFIKDNNSTHMDYADSGRGDQVKHCCSLAHKNGRLCPHSSPDSCNRDETTPNNHHSLHSSDLEPSQCVCIPMPNNARRHSVESTCFPQPNCPSLSKAHTGSNFYSGVQEYPANDIHPLFEYAHVTRSSAAVSRTSIGENLDHSRHIGYYCMTAQQSVHSFAVPQASVKVSSLETEAVQRKSDHSSSDLQNLNKDCCFLAQEQQFYLENDGYASKGGQIHSQSPSLPSAHTPVEKLNIGKWSSSNSRELQEAGDPHDNKGIQEIQNSHSTASDWFAANVITEGQTRRAQVQKNKSTATAAGSETKEDVAISKDECRDTNLSSPEGSSICYKNHLKAAQARVLNATSFKRKDLDPKSVDHHGCDMSTDDSSPNHMQKDRTMIHGCSKVLQNETCGTNVQAVRGGRRKRFPSEQKMHSFSAPDKINEVGIEEVIHAEDDGLFADKYVHYEASDSPVPLKPMVKETKQRCQSSSFHHSELKPGQKSHPGKRAKDYSKNKAPNEVGSLLKGHSSFNSFISEALQGSKWHRAHSEHQHEWTVRRKPLEVDNPRRYSSGDKIQTKSVDKINKPRHKHEQGHTSSPEGVSKQNHPIRESGFTSSFLPEHVEQERAAARLSDRRHSDETVRGKPSPPEILEPPTKNTIRDNSEKRTSSKHIHANPNEMLHSRDPEFPSDSSHSTGLHQHSAREKKETLEEKHCQVQVDGPAITASAKDSQGSLHGRQEARSSNPCSPCAELPLNLVVPWGSLSPCENPHLGVGTEDDQGVLERAGVSSSYMECTLKLQLHTRSQQFSSHGIKLQVSVTIQDECRMENMLENTTVEEAAIMAIPAEDIKEERHQLPLPNKASSSHQLLTPNMEQKGLGHRAAEQMPQNGDSGVNVNGRPLQCNRTSSTPGPKRTTEERLEKDTMASADYRGTSSMFSEASVPTEQFQMRMKNTQIQQHGAELVASLRRKLQVLREEQRSMQEDMRVNDALGEEVARALQKLGKPNQLDKFRIFVGDVDKVVSLLMSLTSRLARVEETLSNQDEQVSPKDKRALLEKRKQLIQQHKDARELKKDLDHRERVVYDILANCLSEERLASYLHFVKKKSVLITEQRKLENEIRLREEQLRGLMDSLPSEARFTSKEDLPLCPDLII